MPTDILLTEENDLRIENGDFVVGESTRQHQNLILLADKGEFKQFPTVGVGILRYLEDNDTDNLAREIRTEFNKDGMNVKEIRFNGSKIDITANYNY